MTYLFMSQTESREFVSRCLDIFLSIVDWTRKFIMLQPAYVFRSRIELDTDLDLDSNNVSIDFQIHTFYYFLEFKHNTNISEIRSHSDIDLIRTTLNLSK